ncbi:CapA family protein [Desulfotruncus alcoholivorax]|uniref:CapA family protein n=1 Tax=Desulfotruncus alcoholivorax TaxID=265477 RepID=UPI00040C1179|nr:CapA family protein [Desulfotruncus alcoholivorax]
MLALSAVLPAGCSAGHVTGVKTAPSPEPRQVNINIVAVGDLLMHMPVIQSVKNPESGRYEFSQIFSPVQGLIQNADYSIANLETRLAGAKYGYSGYPVFNCPADLAGEMKKVGFDLFLTANNHSLDQGAGGVIATLGNIEAAGLDHVGTYGSADAKSKPLIKNIKGIRVGIINYTSITNGIPVPAGKPYLVNVVNHPAILKELQAIKDRGADIIIACVHFGNEYSRYPSEEQKDLVNFLFDSGVDVVLGNHVHVVQPAEIRTVTGKNIKKKKFVIYSLGNFISNQRWRYSDSGLLINLAIEKDLGSGQTTLGVIKLVPTWVDTYRVSGKQHYRILEVDRAIKDYENKADPLLTADDYHRLKQVADELSPKFLFSLDSNFKPATR